MTAWAVIPIKAPGMGKSRLSGVLSEAARDDLVNAMLRHVLEVVSRGRGIDHTFVVGPRRNDMRFEHDSLADGGDGLNAALGSALTQLAERSPSPSKLIVIAADLPCLTVKDLEALCAVSDTSIGIAPDRHGTGTNALVLPLPHAAGFHFRFGTGSASAHAREANRLGLKVETIRSPTLEKDIDEPSDLIDARGVYTFEQ